MVSSWARMLCEDICLLSVANSMHRTDRGRGSRKQGRYKAANHVTWCCNKYAVCLMLFQNMEQFEDIGPSVVLASPGMMQSGLSRELFEAWCTDKRNGCIIAGYCVEGTLAKVRQWCGNQMSPNLCLGKNRIISTLRLYHHFSYLRVGEYGLVCISWKKSTGSLCW